ncbi:cellulase family glycosylhydrolase [bacterium]|nr:cellulase family glycosylhydrolase [bacterium]
MFGKISTVTATLLLLASAGSSSVLAQQNGFYHTQNGIVVDGSGNKAMIRGIGLGGWLMPEGYMLHFPGEGSLRDMNSKIVSLIGETDAASFWELYRANYVREKDIQMIAEWGYDHIRLPFHYNVIYDLESRSFKEEGFELFDRFLDWCKAYGLDVVLDLHAAPGAQNEGPISDSDGEARLWTEPDPYQDMTVEIWEEIARRYANETAIIGYDLINEPVTPDDQLVNGQQDLRDLYGRLTNAIRAIDQNHILFIEGNYYATHFYLLDPAFDNNMVYAFHKYWNAPDVGTIQYLLDLRNNTGVPLWLGETGENSNPWFYLVSRLAEDHDIGWNWWTHKKIEAVTSPLSSPLLPDYQTVLDYFGGNGSRPTTEFARDALFAQARALDIDSATLQSGVLRSLFDDSFATESIPFKEHVLPGTVNAVDYDSGTQGISYYDQDYWKTDGSPGGGNTGGKYRNDGVDIEASTDPEGFDYNVGWLNPLEWMAYTIEVQQSGIYSVEFRVASTEGGGNLRLFVDSENIANVVVPTTGGWQKWISIQQDEIELTAGSHVLRVVVGRKGGFNFNRMTFNLASGTAVESDELPVVFIRQMYPQPASHQVNMELSVSTTGLLKLELYDVLGRLASTQLLKPTEAYSQISIDLGKLTTGTYLARLVYDGGKHELTSVFSVIR